MADDLFMSARALLGPEDPEAVGIVNRGGSSPFLLIGDHAGKAIPKGLGTLGLAAADRARHIALDIGTQALGETLADRLDATFVHQLFSRLVIDCNRDPDRADAAPAISDRTEVPGNAALDAAGRAARVREIHQPYQQAVATEILRRIGGGRPVVLISLHSFTPQLQGGEARPWHVGILHNGHSDRFAHALLMNLDARGDIVVGDNEPYRMDATDHTVPRQAFEREIPYAEIEIRQDLIDHPAGVARWAEILAAALAQAYRSVPLGTRCSDERL